LVSKHFDLTKLFLKHRIWSGLVSSNIENSRVSLKHTKENYLLKENMTQCVLVNCICDVPADISRRNKDVNNEECEHSGTSTDHIDALKGNYLLASNLCGPLRA
jgi:hypothetical protein